MAMPGFTAERSLYRGVRRYRGAATGARSRYGTVTPQQDSECCDLAGCIQCHGTCMIGGPSGPKCLGGHVTERPDKPVFLMAAGSTLWPYHCTSTDHTAEVYCHSGCVATTHDAACWGPGPWGLADPETKPEFLTR